MGSILWSIGQIGIGLGGIIQAIGSKPSLLDQAVEVISKIVVPIINALGNLF